MDWGVPMGLLTMAALIVFYAYAASAPMPGPPKPCPVCEGRGDCMLCDTPAGSERTCIFLALRGAGFECAACGIVIMPSDIQLGVPTPCGMLTEQIIDGRFD